MEVHCPTQMVMLVSERMLAFKHVCAHALDLAIALPLGGALAPRYVLLVMVVLDFAVVLMHFPVTITDMILHAIMQRRGQYQEEE